MPLLHQYQPLNHPLPYRSDEGSTSAAVPAGQGGRFPTDVWGTPPGGDEGRRFYNTTKNGRRRRKKNAGNGGGAGGRVMRRGPNSESVDSGSIVDRRLARYPGREGGGRGSLGESLLEGRKAEFVRAEQQQQQQQLQEKQLPSSSNNSINSITAIGHIPAEGEAPMAVDHPPQQHRTSASTTHSKREKFVAAPAHNGGEFSTTTSDWTTSGNPTTIGAGGIVGAAGRDSEWLAERRAADREAKEVLRALKNNSARLYFLVGGG